MGRAAGFRLRRACALPNRRLTTKDLVDRRGDDFQRQDCPGVNKKVAARKHARRAFMSVQYFNQRRIRKLANWRIFRTLPWRAFSRDKEMNRLDPLLFVQLTRQFNAISAPMLWPKRAKGFSFSAGYNLRFEAHLAKPTALICDFVAAFLSPALCAGSNQNPYVIHVPSLYKS